MNSIAFLETVRNTDYFANLLHPTKKYNELQQ
jgi:hypothetical protein